MKRRETIKTLLVGSLGGATVASTIGCKQEPGGEEKIIVDEDQLYGRTPSEIAYDERIKAEVFLNEEELSIIAVLCDIILPATKDAGSATDAEVPAFIEFIVKDIPRHQLPIRGGLMWLDAEANKRYNKQFIHCSEPYQIAIIDDIAYPDDEEKMKLYSQGISFFNLMRDLTLTGYYTTRMGFEDLGVTSNFPNVWDGVPEEILREQGLTYEAEWLKKCVDQEKRFDIAEWDEEGNLIG